MANTQINQWKDTGMDYETFRILARPFNYDLTQLPLKDTIYLRALYAQFAHEARPNKLYGWAGNSNIFKNYNNGFGMRPSLSRDRHYQEVYHSAQGKYATYRHFTEAIYDRIDLDQWNRTDEPQTYEDVLPYYEEIKRKGYATDPIYVKLVFDMYNTLFGDQPLNTGGDVQPTVDAPQEDADIYPLEDLNNSNSIFNLWGLLSLPSWLYLLLFGVPVFWIYIKYFRKKK